MPSEVKDSLQPPPAADLATLPDSTSNTLEIVPATLEECRSYALINAPFWSGPLEPEAYMRREEHLAATSISRNGGLTGWILVDSEDKSSPRTILAACETLRKRAILARRDGQVEDVVSHGIGSVFCRGEYRGRGYAGRMMRELARVMEGWQQKGEKKAMFNVLYSDIGKKFYAKNGWKPFPSSHVSIPPVESNDRAQGLPDSVPIHDGDLDQLCREDEIMLRESITHFAHQGPDTRVAMIPDADTMRWHHAREEFVAQEVCQRQPKIKGAYSKTDSGQKVWCIWTRVYSKKDNQDATLYILRFAVEGENGFETASHATSTNGASNGHVPHEDRVNAAAACLAAAQAEAERWNMKSVEMWNPSPTILAAARKVSPEVNIIDRDEDSIASLLWYGEGDAIAGVEWVHNEKFGWC